MGEYEGHASLHFAISDHQVFFLLIENYPNNIFLQLIVLFDFYLKYGFESMALFKLEPILWLLLYAD